MLRKHVIVELTPSRLGVALWHGGVIRSSAVERHDASGFRDDWPAAVSALTQPLRRMVETLQVSGRPAIVVYHSPGAVCGVFSCPMSAGRAAWARAARLAIAEAASFPLAMNPWRIAPLVVDPGGASPEAPLAHTLGIADSDAALDSLAAWTESAGLAPVGFVPSGAVDLAATVARAVEPANASSGSALIVLNIGEHTSVLALAARGRLKLVRQLGFGVELLAESLARTLSGRAAGSPEALADARMLLASVGIPAKEQMVDSARGITGATVLPALQPLLQRLLIEAKQSLRFGLTEAQRESTGLLVMGPGACTPGLAGLVASQTGATPRPESAPATDKPPDPRRLGVTLAPGGLRRRLQGRAAARGLWTGGVAAALVVGFLGLDARTDLARVSERLAADREMLAESAEVRATVSRLTAARVGLADALRRANTALAGTTDWGALLTAMAERTPDEISLRAIELAIDRGRPICRVRGQARAGAAGDPTSAVRAYLDRLTEIPIVRECRLGSTQRIGDARDPRQTFILTLTLVDIPPGLTLSRGGTP